VNRTVRKGFDHMSATSSTVEQPGGSGEPDEPDKTVVTSEAADTGAGAGSRPAREPERPKRKMPRMGRLRVAMAIVVSLCLLVPIGAAAGTLTLDSALHASFPQTSGTLHIAGLSDAVTVQRDSSGIPQIYATTPSDLFLAEGYVQAQDRFWQMDVDRHIAEGDLSSMFGSTTLTDDEFVRTLGWKQVAQESYQQLTPQTQQYLQAYSKGVNDYLAAHPGGSSLSIEYDIIGLPVAGTAPGYKPAPWTPVDSVVWLQAMAWNLIDNLDQEEQRALLAQTLTQDQIDQLYPAYPYSQNSPIVTQGALVGPQYEQDATPAPALPGAAQQQLSNLSNLLDEIPSVLGPAGSADSAGDGVGSNSWVVSGALTTTGKPLMANDPHLSPQLPSVWYQVGLHCDTLSAQCPYDVTGFSFPGMPGVIIGHDQDISWGFTNESSDVSDLYLEKITGQDYLYDGTEYPLQEHKETIDVAGGSPVTITVRSTNHGPLLSDVSDDFAKVGKQAPAARAGDPAQGLAPNQQYGVSLEWTALQPNSTMDALFALDRATDWTDFRAAAQDFTVPAQNMIYADTQGDIGYQAPGLIPVRKNGDGRWPEPGWTDQYDWTGYIPFSALPDEYNPASGYIVTANNAVVGPSYPYLLTTDWDYGFRSQEITDDIQKDTAHGGKISIADMSAIQNDTYSPIAAALVPYLLKEKVDSYTKSALALLKNWNYTEPADSAAAAYFNAVWSELLQMTFANKFPTDVSEDDLGLDGGDRWFEVVETILTQPDSPWWDNPKTPQRETRDSILTAALEKARLDLTAQLGPDPSSWQWGKIHTLIPTEQTLGTNGPAVVRWLLDGNAEELGGGSSIVDATSYDVASGNYSVITAPSMRMIVDLADFDDSRWINQTGESGHVDDPNYLDQAPLWASGQTLPWAFSSTATKAKTIATLTLQP
jgi:penicillin G amidase